MFDFYDDQIDNEDEEIQENKREKRPFLGITFECCNVYARIYKIKKEQHTLADVLNACVQLEFR